MFCSISGLGHLHLGCTDASKRPLHLCPTQQRTRDAAACMLVLRLAFFFLFFFLFSRFTTQADSCRCALNRANSCQLRPYRSISGETAETPKFKKKKKKVQNLLLFLSLSCFPTSTQSRCCVNWFRNTKERLKKEKA